MATPPDLWGFRKRDQWLYVAIAVLLLATIAVPLHWVMAGPVACPARWILELPCPGCGLTRSFALMGHGDWWSAWRHHPFGAMGWCCLWLILIGKGWQRWSGVTVSLFPRGIFTNSWVRLVLVVWLVWGIRRMVVGGPA